MKSILYNGKMRVENQTKLESEKTRVYAHRNLDWKCPSRIPSLDWICRAEEGLILSCRSLLIHTCKCHFLVTSRYMWWGRGRRGRGCLLEKPQKNRSWERGGSGTAGRRGAPASRKITETGRCAVHASPGAMYTYASEHTKVFTDTYFQSPNLSMNRFRQHM